MEDDAIKRQDHADHQIDLFIQALDGGQPGRRSAVPQNRRDGMRIMMMRRGHGHGHEHLRITRCGRDHE